VSARIKRRFPGVRVPDERHARASLAVGAADVLVLLDALELLAELGDAVADLALVELERRLARASADACRAPCAAGGLAEPRRVYLRRAISTWSLASRLFAWRWKISTMTPVRSSTSHAGRALEVARLAGGDLVIDGHELDRGRSSEVSPSSLVARRRRRRRAPLPGGGAPCRASAGHVSAHVARASGELGELVELSLAEHGRGGDRARAAESPAPRCRSRAVRDEPARARRALDASSSSVTSGRCTETRIARPSEDFTVTRRSLDQEARPHEPRRSPGKISAWWSCTRSRP
jgi:hypothetical protein